MDGSIELKSKAGVGTTVIVKIPFKIGTQDKNSNLSDKLVSLDDYSVEGMRALVVEDNELNMEISRCILEDSGMEVTCAVDGQEAVEIFEKSALLYRNNNTAQIPFNLPHEAQPHGGSSFCLQDA